MSFAYVVNYISVFVSVQQQQQQQTLSLQRYRNAVQRYRAIRRDAYLTD